jgi:hypothetical protein
MGWGIVPVQERDNMIGLFSLKSFRNLARAFFTSA